MELCWNTSSLRFHRDNVRALLAARKGILPVSILLGAVQGWACDASTFHCQRNRLTGAHSASAESEGRDVGVPLRSCQVELLVSFKKASVRRVGFARREGRVQAARLVLTSWAAFTREGHRVGALDGRAHDGVTYQTTSLTGAHDALLVPRRPLGPVVEDLAIVVALVVGLDAVDLVVLRALVTRVGPIRHAARHSDFGQFGKAVVRDVDISNVSPEFDLLRFSRFRGDQKIR